MGDFENWEYPPKGAYSMECRDGEGYLRVSGRLLKKGGSRRKNSLQGLQYRRNWSDRWFHMDLIESTLRYYFDEEMEQLAGEVRFIPAKTTVTIPNDVRLTGRHAPKEGQPVDYMELVGTADATGAERTVPFALRAATLMEFNEWQRTFAYAIKSLGVAGFSSSSSTKDDAKASEDKVEEKQEEPRYGSLGFDEEDREYDDSDASPTPRYTQDDLRDVDFYYQSDPQEGDSQKGPVGLAALRDAWKAEAIGPKTHVYTDAIGEWLPINDLPELERLLQPKPPPLPRTMTL
mmetsp:Transcript_12597/g.41297  ORF Transcript_12597/g.41297 Transcript_12597/m.41297 type:complete len:290 (-) Transcript_12597:589-1458(-)